MNSERPQVAPLLAQLSVQIPSEKSQGGEQRPQRGTLFTRMTKIADETTDDD